MGVISRGLRFAAALVLAASASTVSADALTDRARQLMSEKKAKEAYALLLAQESARAGDPEFDYLLGISALDAGEAERAVFALERVLAVQPDNHVARAEIARAYLALGERNSARREFEAVRKQQIPEEAKATIDRFLQAIAAADVTQVAGFAELAVGHDSNVNSATASGQIAIPVLGGVIATLDSTATKRADYFTNLSGGVSVTHKLDNEWALVGGATLAEKLNRSEKNFDTRTLDGNIGTRWTRGAEAVTLGAQLQNFELDYATYRETKGLIGQWQHTFDDSRQGTGYVQYSELRYPTQSVRNANRLIGGVAYAQAFAARFNPVLFVSAYAGREGELSTGVPHLGHRPWGARAGVQLTIGDGWQAFANAAYEERRYGGADPVFLVTRKDEQTDLSAGVSYLLRPGATLIGQIADTDNRSNIDINRFRRTLLTLSLRLTF